MMIETEQQGLWIGGVRVAAGDGASFAVRNPATGEVIAEVARAGAAETRAAIDAAAAAQAGWAALSGNERAKLLTRAYERVKRNIADLARLLSAEQGKPLRESEKEVVSTGAFIRFYAEEARRIYGDVIPSPDTQKRVFVLRQPVGVVGVLTPFNFPVGMFGRKVPAALAAGCAVVCKPAEETSLTTLALAELFADAGLPAGTLNVVCGDAPAIATALIEDARVRVVSFTGSVAVGQALAEQGGHALKRMILELGGVAPYVVCADADLPRAVNGLIVAKFRNAGQVCAAPQRVFVHKEVASAFREALVEATRHLRLGPGLDETSDVGPLINERAVQKVQELIDEALGQGARILCGGQRQRGLFYEPTVLDAVPETARLAQEEAFGPVIALSEFTDEQAVIAEVNRSPYGLGAYVFTRDIARAFQLAEGIEAGIVGVNDPLPATVEGPFGGVKRSGQGLEGGRYGVSEFLTTKQVSLRL